ncbi:major facilitator superfamily domain-containing protein [Irpex rosettiformis]|uniref:Major facilitator superfamily domain-containing protein n=1 Tax=Irpex rosettiformis TaxID=378272 RepID=A0ACB8U540_9APHY|nr:major facilitator superfamily domain-containing protein [Irpex rosettiformis]
MSDIEKRGGKSPLDDEKSLAQVIGREAASPPGSREESRLREVSEDGVDESFREKCHLINECLQHEIGFGRYQKELFLLSGFGWLADNLWLQGVAVLLPQINAEFNPPRVEYTTFSLFIGLICGAITWGSLSDIIGRRLSWQITLCIAGIFGIASGGANSFVTLCSLVACLGFGVGGNLPVDGALFLENIPQSHQWLLTFLSAWWSIGQVISSVIVWGFLSRYSNDKAWRLSFYTLGSLTFGMFVCRYLIFTLQESPKFLVAIGHDEEAIEALTYIAKRNGKTISLTADRLLALGRSQGRGNKESLLRTLKNSFAHFSLSHVRPLFSTRPLAINTTLIILIWGLIGLAYPLFNGFLVLYLQDKLTFASSVSRTYRDYTIVAVFGIPGSALACLIVDWTRGSESRWAIGGRKLALSISTLATGLFLFLFTTTTTEAAYLGFSCASSLTQNAMYGVLYAYTPEAFPTPHRGTGDALASAVNRVMGLIAPIIKIVTTSRDGSSTVDANVPVFISASLFVVSAILAMLLPIETAGKAVL